MALKPQSSTVHNAIIGRMIPHLSSTTFHNDETLPPTKRLKTLGSNDGEDSHGIPEDESNSRIPNRYRDEIPDSEDDDDALDQSQPKPARPTELESALPPIKTDKEAIAEYEAMRASEQDNTEILQGRLKERKWTKGKNSIYVDAFNLALETVLGDEGHLFDEKELEVFNQWRDLDYESQYL